MFYGSGTFDPLYILAQIVAVQCLYYLGLGTLLFVLVGPFVPTLTTRYIFNYKAVNIHSNVGILTTISFLLSSIFGSAVLLFIVERAKKCLDFAVTCFIIHLSITMFQSGIPKTIDWWILQIVIVAIMAVLGEWICIQKEIKEIPVGSLGQQLRQQREQRDNGTATPSTSTASDDSVYTVATRTISRVLSRVGFEYNTHNKSYSALTEMTPV